MKYFFGFSSFAAYLLLLSIFVGEKVGGGVRGGTPVNRERVGLRTIVTWYQGGEQVVYNADPIVAEQLQLLAQVAVSIGIIVGVIVVVWRGRGIGNLIGGFLAAGFMGLLTAFVTGMPVALELKGATPESFLTIVGLLCVIVLPFLILIGHGIGKLEGWE